MSDPRYARSFETVAEQYERARPEYAEAAVDWVAERLGLEPGARVLDLGAGTGKLTRQLVRRGFDAVAVEPGDEMRGGLQRAVPRAEALAGTAEAIPEWAGSTSGVINAPREEQARIEAEIRRLAGPGERQVSIKTQAFVAQLSDGSSGIRATSS